MSEPRTLEIHTSPHIASGASVDVIMRNVVWALLPVAMFSINAAIFWVTGPGTFSSARSSICLAGKTLKGLLAKNISSAS